MSVWLTLQHYFVISLGDIESQRKLLEEMQRSNIKPTSFTYDELMGTYLLKYDIFHSLH